MIAALWLLLAFQISPDLRRHIDAGMQAKARGDLDSAIQEFKRLTELAPEMSAAYVNLGAVYLAKKDYSAAAPALRRAIALQAEMPGAHAMLGTALLAQGFGCDSIPHLEKGKAEDLLGVALLECNRPREALDWLEAALERRPADPDLLYYVSQAHAALAKHAFETLRGTSPDSPRTHQMLGEVLASNGDRVAAEKHFRAALSSRSDLRGVHYALGELLLQTSDYQKAEEEFRKEAQLSPGSAAAAFKLGVVLANLGRTTEAIDELKRSHRLRADMPETLLELGKLLNASGDANAAEPFLKQLLSIEQHTPLAEAAHLQLSQVYRKLGRKADAERELKAFQDLRNSR